MTPPTDLELMMFHDGELDEARHGEVEAYLQGEGSRDGASKLAGLGLVSALVIESQATVARAQQKQADSIASSVITRLDKENAFEGQSSRRPLAGEAAAANDNGRFIMVLAGLAAAAAAALFVWGRTTPPEPAAAVDTVEAPTAELAPPAPVETVAVVPSASASAAVPAVEVEQESEPSVEVASVDFSAASGAVYYVPSDSVGQTTAVVWLKDE
jgi:hypothetical protein